MEIKDKMDVSGFMAGSMQNVGFSENNNVSTDFAAYLEKANHNSKKVDSDSNIKRNTEETVCEKDNEYVVDTEDISQEKVQSDDSVVDETVETVDETIEDVVAPEDAEVTEIMLEPVQEIPDEELQAILISVSSLVQRVTEYFDLDVEELSVKLEEFGMELTDLTTTDGLKTFFLEMNQAEPADLIIDENLNNQMQTFMDDMQEVLQTFEDVEVNFADVITDENLQIVMDELNNLDLSEMQDDVLVEAVEQQVKEPEVIVEKDMAQTSFENGNQKQQAPTQTKNVQHTQTNTDNRTISKETTFENPILQAIQNAVDQVEGNVVTDQPIEQTDVVQQIVEQVKVQMNQNTTSLELQLYPEHLGKIQIQVVSKDGVMTAKIVAESEAAKQAIEGGLTNLKEAMQQQELKVDAIEVMVSTMGFERNDERQGNFEQKHTSRSSKRIDISELTEEVSSEEEAEMEKMRASGSSVSYTA